MANLIRTDPFRELTRFDPFRDFEALPGWPRLRRWLAELPEQPQIKLDITEDDKAYYVKADLPGVKKEDIDVQIVGSQVSLTAEVTREKEEKKDETLVHSERYYGKQFRTFTLQDEIDDTKAEAKFVNGVLELVLPKTACTTTHKVAVQ